MLFYRLDRLARPVPRCLARPFQLRSALLAALLSITTFLPVCALAQAPVVVAMDTSRSLNGAALAEVVDRLRLTLEALDEDTPTGLLAFDDEPRWEVEIGASPREVADALRGLTLQGNYTLLNDALFVATRELENGGVLLLATDGRDENSAVVVDDIARRCEAQGVRIVSIGTGRSVEEKALRRLALLSNGAYLGPVGSVDASSVAEGVKIAQQAVAAAPRAARSSSPGPAAGPAAGAASQEGSSQAGEAQPAGSGAPAGPSQPAGTQPVTQGPTATGSSSFLQNPLIWAAAAALLLLTTFIALRRRGGGAASSADDDEIGEALRVAELQSQDVAEAEQIRLELAQTPDAKEEEAPEVTVDTAVFQRMTLDERLDRTRVLSNNSVLIMRKLGEAPRTFMLDRLKAFAVGRDRVKNTLGIPDPALSAQHFKIVPRDEDYFFVDLESTNGSFVNARRVGAKRLRHGDVIRAGQVEFEFQDYSNV